MSRSYLALVILIAGIAVPMFLLGRGQSSAKQIAVDDVGDFPPRGYVCYRASGPLVIDGKLDDSAWANVPWSEPFRDIEGDKKPDPPYRTRVKMLWDDEALYIAAELEEPHVWATLTEHDAVIFHDNDFEVFLDPDSDSHDYGELELNALNTTWDLFLTKPYKDGGRALHAWEITGLRTAVHVNGTINDPSDRDTGWTIEIVWPWKGIREYARRAVPPVHGEQWRINFSRVEWDMEIVDGKYVKIPKRPEHNWVWSPQGVINMHLPEKWGILQFSKQPIGSTTLLADPSQPARDYLHSVYHAQREYRRVHGHRAEKLSELGLKALPSNLRSPRLETTQKGYEASVLLLGDGKRERWRITSDGRVLCD